MTNNKKQTEPVHSTHKIVGGVNYCINDILSYLAKELDVPALIPCLGSEKYVTVLLFFSFVSLCFKKLILFINFCRYTSGVVVFGIDDKVCQQIEMAKNRTYGKHRKYWVVTIRIPNEIKGKHRLGITLKTSVLGGRKVHLFLHVCMFSMYEVTFTEVTYAFSACYFNSVD